MNHSSNIEDSKPVSIPGKEITNFLWNKESLSWTPEYLGVSAWTEHIPFAFWIIEVMQPKVLVELGVHNGVSYFSFCQAVKRMNIETTCYGVDTWRGDEHAGYYDEVVFKKVTDQNKEFERFSTLVRSTFDEAGNYFIDGSVDLLHIDGLHTYDAVKHDYENWLPKLSPRGIIIFHDINVRERNFGVFKLWEELKQQYRHFQFDFGNGLGILAMDGVNQEEIRLLLNKEQNDPYYRFLRNNFSDRGSSFKKIFESSLALKQATESISQVNEKFEALSDRYQKMENAANAEIHRLDKEIGELKNKIKESGLLIQKQDQSIRWYKNTYENRNIAGVIKEKIRHWRKKKIGSNLEEDFQGMQTTAGNKVLKLPVMVNNYQDGKLRRNRYNLKPANDITIDPRSGFYTVTGTDPFFIADTGFKFFSAGWYWLSIGVVETEGMLLAPKLYYDCGKGFNEEHVLYLPKKENGRIEGLINFPAGVSRLRFDPTITPCRFSLQEFYLKSLTQFKALQLALSAYKKIHYPATGRLSFYAGLTRDWRKSGQHELRKKIRESVNYLNEQYADKYIKWCALYDTLTSKQVSVIESLSGGLSHQPLFSVIMPVYNAPVSYLKAAIESVRRQAYKNWELCIADDHSTDEEVKSLLITYSQKDSRIKVIFREENGHISKASNSALELATGEYIVLLDQDDELPAHCLYMVARAIDNNRDLGIIYSDEDKIDLYGRRFDPYFKTDWNKDLFYGQNMISHLGVYKLSLVRKVGGFRAGYEGSQDYDLALRCIEQLEDHQIHHIPHVLYHWRAIEGSTAVDANRKNYALDAGLRALNDHLQRTAQVAVAELNVHNSYRVKWSLPARPPLVSIIVPTRNKTEVLKACLTSVLEKTGYRNFEILVIDNNSDEPSTLTYLAQVQAEHNQVKVFTYNAPFNFSAMINYGVSKSSGEVVLLLNNDTEVINDEWLGEMLSQCMRNEIGAVGAKLFYPGGQVQHAGVYLYEGHPGIHIYLKRENSDPGYFNKLNLVQHYSAVTAACLAVRKELFLEAGGFDEHNLTVVYNDVDFCLKLKELGYKNLFTPFARLVHHESLSRGDDMDEANYARFKKEHSFMLKKWKDLISKDPYFNPNLAVDGLTTEFAFPPRVPYEWQENSTRENREDSYWRAAAF